MKRDEHGKPVLDSNGRPFHTWDPFKMRLPTEDEARAWFDRKPPPGIALICGRVSGGRFVLDFEFLDFFEEWAILVDFQAPGLAARLPIVRTPGRDEAGGRHVHARCSTVPVRSAKLARFTRAEAEKRTGDPGKITGVEVKGEGGYVLVPGCPAECHSTGRLYEHVSGPPVEDAPDLTANEVDILFSSACALERGDKAAADRTPATAGDQIDRPGDDFNQRASWDDVLPAGWKKVRVNGDVIYLCRPGKYMGVSATIGYCKSERAGPKLYVFSTNAEPFEAERSYCKFEAYALLQHGGDFKAAARDLVDKGYGQQTSTQQAAAGMGPKEVEALLASIDNIGRGSKLLDDGDLMRGLARMSICDPWGFARARGRCGDNKVRLRDFDAAIEHLRQQIIKDMPAPPGATGPYQETDAGIVWFRPTQAGPVGTQLTNFDAYILADVAHDDGTEIRRHFEVKAVIQRRAQHFVVPADRFDAVNWATDHLGAAAIIFPGLALRCHVPVAIRMLSGDVPRRTVYAHTGWRCIDGQYIFLDAAGAIGRDGRVFGIETALSGNLAHFVYPDPPSGELLKTAVQASLRLRHLAKPRIAFSLLATTYRAVLDLSDFSTFLVGPTHEGKSELAARQQQHFGPAMDARNFPANWSSTANSLEGLAHQAQHMLLVIDDFAPGGGSFDVAKLHREADRILRAQGNRSGRLRMRADGTLRPEKHPRGLILATGEDVPRGQSLRGRTLILEVGPGDVDWTLMTQAQQDGAAGLFAQAMAGFIQWLARRYEEVRRALAARVKQLREQATQSGMHRRTPYIVANLFAAWELWLEFAQEAGAVGDSEAELLRAECWSALGEAAAAQAAHQKAAEPTRRFLELLTAAIASGRAHVAAPDGKEPEDPRAWGWRETTVGTGDYARDEWRPMGECVGWLDAGDLYLEPDSAYAVVQVLGRDGGEPLTVGLSTLKRRLKARGLLASTDPAHETLTVRRTLGGKRRELLHFLAQSLAPSSRQPDQPDQDAKATGSGSGSGANSSSPSATTRPPQELTQEELTPSWSGWSGFGEGGGTPPSQAELPWSGNGTDPTSEPTPNRSQAAEPGGTEQDGAHDWEVF
jgi:hypothetical protein